MIFRKVTILLSAMLFLLVPLSCLLAREVPPENETSAGDGEERMRIEALARYVTSYDSGGRRDPFEPGFTEEERDRRNLPGLKGVYIEELKLVGIYSFEGEAVAIFKGGPEDKGYTARKGDEFRNGKVMEINYPGRKVIVRKDIKERGTIRKYEDITIRLHPLED